MHKPPKMSCAAYAYATDICWIGATANKSAVKNGPEKLFPFGQILRTKKNSNTAQRE